LTYLDYGCVRQPGYVTVMGGILISSVLSFEGRFNFIIEESGLLSRVYFHNYTKYPQL